MTIDQRIRTALLPSGFDVENAVYSGKHDTYYVFNYTTFGDMFADDEPDVEKFFIQVHLFCPLDLNISSLKLDTKQRLFAAGMTWPVMTDASDQNARHIVFECEITCGVDVNGSISD